MAWRVEGPWLVFTGIESLGCSTFVCGISVRDALEKTESPDIDHAFI